jgi:hypothetical protein
MDPNNREGQDPIILDYHTPTSEKKRPTVSLITRIIAVIAGLSYGYFFVAAMILSFRGESRYLCSGAVAGGGSALMFYIASLGLKKSRAM